MRIAVLGGGPGGLFAATLAKRSDPTREVVVCERNAAGDTFGFGVVFSDATLAAIDEADPVLRTALQAHGAHWDPVEVRLHAQRLRCGGMGMAAVERKTLLRLLQQGARAEGVELRFGTSASPDELVAAGYDLVVAADGANSAVRSRYAEQFGPSVDTATAKFVWFGTTYPFDGLTFVHERGPHGVFAVHGYPIGNGVSTFIVETDEASWRAAGLDGFDVTRPPGRSDEFSRDYLQELFAPAIDGAPLLTNNSRWGNFRTWRAARWSHRDAGTAFVLLGDAAHTAHFSVGSGTKMAMEDAVALVAALDGHPTDHPAGLDTALAGYEELRRPRVTRIQDSARPSLSWWEHFGRSHDHLRPWQFAYHFLTRSLSDEALARRDPAFVASAHARWSATTGRPVLDSPLQVAGRTVPGRRVDSRDGVAAHRVRAPDDEGGLDAAAAAVAGAVGAGAAVVAVHGGTPLTRRLVCEAARFGHGVCTLLVEDADDDTAVTAVLSGRTDLVGAP